MKIKEEIKRCILNIGMLLLMFIIINITLTYITTGLVYTLVFYLIAYINLIDIKNTIFMGVSSFLIGIIITLLNTLIIDLIFKKKVKKC